MARKKKRGIALISVLLVLTALMTMTMGFAAFTTTDYAISQSYYSSTITFYLAQAGLEHFFYLMKHNMLIYPTYASNVGAYPPYASQGNIVNALGTTHEAVILSSIDWGDLFSLFQTDRYFGSCDYRAVERQDDNAVGFPNRRVLYVTSIGYIKQIWPNALTNDASLWSDANYAGFRIRAKRTLMARVPYSQLSDCRTNDPYNAHLLDLRYEILNDAWYERFR
jgi:hypothetical protein